MDQNAQLNQIEVLIAALKQERDSLERRLALLHDQQDVVDDAIRWYFSLWRLRWESELKIWELSPVHGEVLKNLLDYSVVVKQSKAIEDQLSRLISEGQCITLAEIEGIIPIIDDIIKELESVKGQIARRERSALRTAKNLAIKVVNVGGGAALIGIDLPVLELTSVIFGSILILRTALSQE